MRSAAAPDRTPVGRLLRSTDFERVLAVAPRARSAHFALHHVAARPSTPVRRPPRAAAGELSTADAPGCPPVVDEGTALVPAPVPEAAPEGCWLGTVVPKRHARRAVTRNVMKRQARACVQACAPRLPAGLWVLRLKSPFDTRRFPSADSPALRAAVRDELAVLFGRVLRPAAAPAAG